MRLFIAIKLDSISRLKVMRIQEDLARSGLSGKLTSPDNFHLTLVFLGETSETRISDIIDSINLIHTQSDIKLDFDKLGFFSSRSGLIYWLGIAHNPELLLLQSLLHRSLSSKGFPIEDRKFSPHITLIRSAKNSLPIDINIDAFSQTVKRISLMVSEKIDNSLIYREIFGKSL